MRQMKTTLMTLGLVLAALLMIAPSSALADDAATIKAKTKKAMDEYDMMEFESAKALLNDAIAFGTKKDAKGPALAAAYVSLGIVLFSGLDEQDGAAAAFANAVSIDAGIELDVAYSTPELAELLKTAREGLAGQAGACIRSQSN